MTHATFFRLLEAEDKSAALLDAIHQPQAAAGRRRFEVDLDSFASVPRSPFAYWVSDHMRRLFTELPAFESNGRTTKHGAATLDDMRFCRLATEVANGDGSWRRFVKGGRFATYYQDVPLLLHWCETGTELKAFVAAKVGSASRTIQATDFYFRPGITWPLRGTRFSAQAVPAGCIFSVAGKMAFVPGDAPASWLALFNSQIFDRFIAFFAGKGRRSPV